MQIKDIGVALIGTGFMSAVHTEALRRVGVTLVGILGSTPAKSRVAAERLNFPRAYSSLEDILCDDRVHAIHVNTPNRWHLAQAAAALTAGKHVLCEKPLAMDATESAQLVALAAANPHLAAGVNYNNRYYALCREARQKTQGGEVGRIFHVTGSVAQDWLLYDTDYNWRVLAQEQGELRALADIGSHWLDLIHFVTGLEVESLCADFTTVHLTRQRPKGEVETFANISLAAERETESVPITTDDYGCVMLRFVGGARGVVWVSQVSPGRKYRVGFEIAGQSRTLNWNSEECERLWIGRRDGANELLVRDPSLLSDFARRSADYPGGHNEGYPDSFKMCFRSFYEYIAAGDFAAPPTFPTFAEGHRDILLCEAMVKSFREGGWVSPSL